MREIPRASHSACGWFLPTQLAFEPLAAQQPRLKRAYRRLSVSAKKLSRRVLFISDSPFFLSSFYYSTQIQASFPLLSSPLFPPISDLYKSFHTLQHAGHSLSLQPCQALRASSSPRCRHLVDFGTKHKHRLDGKDDCLTCAAQNQRFYSQERVAKYDGTKDASVRRRHLICASPLLSAALAATFLDLYVTGTEEA